MNADLDAASLDAKERGLMDLVEKVTRHAYRTTAEDMQALRELGWTDEELAEAVQVAAIFAMFNRVADAFGLEDPGYFALAQKGNAVQPASRYHDEDSKEG